MEFAAEAMVATVEGSGALLCPPPANDAAFSVRKLRRQPALAVLFSVMNATQTAEFRKRLLEERDLILAKLKSHIGEAGPTGGWDMRDQEERPLEITNEDLERQLAEDDRNLLEKIDFALRRLDEGTYDRCANCGQPIPLERLTAKPAVSLCISCQEENDAAKDAEFVPPR